MERYALYARPAGMYDNGCDNVVPDRLAMTKWMTITQSAAILSTPGVILTV
jgi:hypothetical protein